MKDKAKSIYPVVGGYVLLIIAFCLFYQNFNVKPIFVYLTAGDVWEYYHDFYYRADLGQIFDFTHKTRSLGSSTYYQPISTLAFNLLFVFADQNPYVIYFAGMVMHCLNAMLVGAIVFQLTKNRILILLTAGLFLLHPFNVLTVTQTPSILTHPIAALFYLFGILCFILYLEKERKLWLVFSVIGFTLGCLVKIYVVMFLPVLVLLDLIRLREKDELKLSTPRLLESVLLWSAKYIPFALVSLACIAIALYNQPRGAIAHIWGDASINMFSLLRLMDYLTINYLPFLLKSQYSAFYVVLVLFLLSTVLYYGDGKLRMLIAWTVLSYLMFVVSNYRSIETLNRYFYAASIPTAMTVSLLIQRIISKVRNYAQSKV